MGKSEITHLLLSDQTVKVAYGTSSFRSRPIRLSTPDRRLRISSAEDLSERPHREPLQQWNCFSTKVCESSHKKEARDGPSLASSSLWIVVLLSAHLLNVFYMDQLCCFLQLSGYLDRLSFKFARLGRLIELVDVSG
jgi:hypothetical protein